MASALLDVYVKDHLVGALGPTAGSAYAFNYLPGTRPEDLVSLTMPVRLESYTWRRRRAQCRYALEKLCLHLHELPGRGDAHRNPGPLSHKPR
jgi:hypothetical protein